MPRYLTLREYTAGFVLLIVVIGSSLSFSGNIFTNYNTQLTGENKDTIKKLQGNISKNQPNIAQQENKTNSISTQTDTFFLSSVLTVIESVTSGVGKIPTIATSVFQGLNLSTDLLPLLSLPVIAVIWEVVSLYRGLRT